ncbi:MAG: hypothetical protein ACLR8Y_08335 [Alistipes indistinctus]
MKKTMKSTLRLAALALVAAYGISCCGGAKKPATPLAVRIVPAATAALARPRAPWTAPNWPCRCMIRINPLIFRT